MNGSPKSWFRPARSGIPPWYLAVAAFVGIAIFGCVGAVLCFGQPLRLSWSSWSGLSTGMHLAVGNVEPGDDLNDGDLSGEVEPIGTQLAAFVASDDFSHGEQAVFHGHGEKVCASGCAASRHPTARLSKREYLRLIDQLSLELKTPEQEPGDSPLALDTLLYYGRQTSQMMEWYGTGDLPEEEVASLKRELKYTHALISIRVVDESGTTRSWLEPTKVPFDRRHVFSMETCRLQPLVTSGTIKRVGRNHLWTRL